MGKGKGYEYYRKKDHAELFAAVMSADPDAVEAVADGWKVSSEVLAQAEADMVNALDTLMASWKGEAAEDFQHRVGTLRQYMDVTQSDLRDTNEQLKYIASSTRWAQEEAKSEADPGDNLDIDDFRKRFGDDMLGTGADMLRDLNGGRHKRLAEIVSKVSDDFQHWVSDDGPDRTPPLDMPGTPSYPDRHNVNPDDVASVGPHPVAPGRVPFDMSRPPEGSMPSKDDVRDWIDRVPGSDNVRDWINRIPEEWRDKIPWPGGGDDGSGTPPGGSEIDRDDIWGGPHPVERMPFDRDDISGGPEPAGPYDRVPDSGGGGGGGGGSVPPPGGGGNVPTPAPSPEPSIPGPSPTPNPDGNGPGWNFPDSGGGQDNSDLSDGLQGGTPAPPGGGSVAPPSPGPAGPSGPGGGGPGPMPGGPGGAAPPPPGRASVPSAGGPGGAGGGSGAPRPIGGGSGGAGSFGGGARGSASVGGAGGSGSGSGGVSGGRGGLGPSGIGGGASGTGGNSAAGGRGGMGMMPMMGGAAGGGAAGGASGGGKGRGGKKKGQKKDSKTDGLQQGSPTSPTASTGAANNKGENGTDKEKAPAKSPLAAFDFRKKKSDETSSDSKSSKKDRTPENDVPVLQTDDGMSSGVDLMETEFEWMEFDPDIGPDSNDPKDVLMWEMKYDMWLEEKKQQSIDEKWRGKF